MIRAKRARTADTGTSLVRIDTALLELMLSFFRPKVAGISKVHASGWETAMSMCRCSKAMRQALLPYVSRQLCWPADVVSTFTGERVRRREDVLYMTGFMGNFAVPPLLKYLSCGHYFNQPIAPGDLPATLTQLTFGSCFNQPIGERVLPQGLTELSFGHDFNHPIGVGILPASLTAITVGHDFNQAIDDGVLPRGLKRLTLPKWMFRFPLDSKFTWKMQDTLHEFGITMIYVDCNQCHVDCSSIKNCPDCKCPNCQSKDGCNCKECQRVYVGGGTKRWSHKAFLKSLESSSDEEW